MNWSLKMRNLNTEAKEKYPIESILQRKSLILLHHIPIMINAALILKMLEKPMSLNQYAHLS